MPLTNEQLFDLIKDGNEDLKPILWERVKKWLHKLCNDFYRNNKDMCLNRGIEAQDIKQMSYIAYLSFFSAYSTDKQYSVLTALKYALYNELRANLGSGTDVLNRITQSLSEPIGEEEDSCTLEELIADEGSSAPFEQIEDSSERESISGTLHEAIAELDEREQEVINGRYFREKTFEELSQDMNISRERVRQVEARALRHLRKPKIVRRLQDDLGYSSYRLYDMHSSVEYIATERVYLDELYKQYKEEQENRERLAAVASCE